MKKLILITILILAAILRFNELNTLPALNADEAAIGYNAYSLLQTGKDEHGNPWPISFQSFNDYKPSLFFYIVLPFVKLLGLSELAVRIPGAALGVATVLLVWLLAKELFPQQKKFSIFKPERPSFAYFQFSISEIAALLLAISPWHIHFSRGGWEVNVATFFITLGIWLFLKGLKNNKFLVLSVLSLIASLYTYHAARVVVPLLMLGLLLIYRKALWTNRSKLILPILIGGLLIIPLVRDLTGEKGISRASGVSIFADQGVIERINEQRGEHGNINSIPALILHNKIVNYSLDFLNNWGEHFWGEFLFLSGDEIQRNRVPETGLLYIFQLPLVIIGLLSIARSTAGWGIILWWLIVTPAAAALTFQSPHALRAHNMVIPLTIISSFGLLGILDWLSRLKFKFLRASCYLLLVVIISWEFSRYLHQYYIHMVKEYPSSSQYGVKELVTYVKENYDNYPKFAITDKYDQPYILFLFYLKYPPEKFQGNHALTPRDKFGFSTVRDFDKFHFEEINNWDEIIGKYTRALIIGTDKEIPDNANIIHKIYFPNGKAAFKIVAN
ncbi:glycosyltransferase family 39 protein [Candidatus Microgenomates bacterium]|nr:glycosyltransferase family 39 protein [Candidatus Microgenomates bacterium]